MYLAVFMLAAPCGDVDFYPYFRLTVESAGAAATAATHDAGKQAMLACAVVGSQNADIHPACFWRRP